MKRPVERYDFKAFGQAIKNARNERGKSRKNVSDDMNISPHYLANIDIPIKLIFLKYVL